MPLGFFKRGYSHECGESIAPDRHAHIAFAPVRLIASLRAGRVVITASGRRIALPEHPLLWAGFFLSGEP